MAMNPADARPRRILVVDDEDAARLALGRLLHSLGYETEVARDGIEALAKIGLDIDLVMLDGTMPGMDGFTLARRIRDDAGSADIPLIMVSGLDHAEHRLHAIAAGVDDFVAKPYDPMELRLRTQRLLELRDATATLRRQQDEMEHAMERRTASLREALDRTAEAQRLTHAAHLDTIRRLVIAAEFKDRDTARHIERIGRYSEVVAAGMRLPPGEVEVIRHASPMHDVGKIGVPDAILLKAGQLTPEEWAVMQQHTSIGARILRGSPSEVIREGERIALSHHERWDGTGYPNGIAGLDIPVGARICAIVDVFDALTTNRHYRDALPDATVLDMMRAQAGKHFDPDILAVFLDCVDAIGAIREEHQDKGADEE
ncbi:MAG: response regulator [Gemmatimonadota bacterium]|nr:response regulator [Gemmatimonadota bacterium]